MTQLMFNLYSQLPKPFCCKMLSSVCFSTFKLFCTQINIVNEKVEVCGKSFTVDEMTNVTPNILSKIGRNLHCNASHPLYHIKQRITKFLYSRYTDREGNPLFSIFDQLSPVVTVEQNFDQLLIPKNHISRKKSDNYYINSHYLLRAHTSAHQLSLMSMGLDNFLVVGDVYRRDSIDSSHYPVFHQMEGVKLFTVEELLPNRGEASTILTGAPSTEACDPSNNSGQLCHTTEAVTALTRDLQVCLQDLTAALFGKNCRLRWVPAYFPFTQPSWELEIFFSGQWLEVLGCGIMQQRLLENAGVTDKVGWAFGLGLERLAMRLYSIPDIRLFWSQDRGFLSQFDFQNCDQDVAFKPVSVHPYCSNDISFWLPLDREFERSDFFDLVRDVGGDIIEQVEIIDEFTHPKTGNKSECYRIVYRHMEKTLTQEEVSVVHKRIEELATENFGVIIR